MGGLSINAVVFDADGTLFDTEHAMEAVWFSVCEEIGFSKPAEDYLEFIGLNRAALLSLMAEKYGSEFDADGFMTRCAEGLHRHIETCGLPLKPGTCELLEFLHKKGIPMALATSTHRIRTDRRLELSGLAKYFQITVTGNEVSQGKPHPEIYLTACEKLGFSPSACLAVEDSRNGILSAYTAGLSVVMIPDMIPPTPDLEEKLLCRFSSLTEVISLFSE